MRTSTYTSAIRVLKSTPVYVEVVIDGERVVSREFLVEGQHNWILFDLNLGSGDHSIVATADDGLATLTDEFATSDRHWAVLDFWSEGGGEFFTFDVFDGPIGFA